MPKQVDREERRREIAAAVLRLVTTRGVEAASLRAVAAEAGVSMGAVQHYFTTKDEMLRFALAYGNTLLGERGTRLGEERKPATPRETFRLFCTLLLPLDEDSKTAARLWAGLIGRACVDEPTRKLAAMAYANLTDFVVRQLGDALPGADVAQTARHLVSLIEGLRWPVLFGVYTEQQAMNILDAQLDLTFGPAIRLATWHSQLDQGAAGDLRQAELGSGSPSSNARISPCCCERRMGKSDGAGCLSTHRRTSFSLRTVGPIAGLGAEGGCREPRP